MDVMERTDAGSRADDRPRVSDPRDRSAANPNATAAKAARRKAKSSRQFWLRQLHAWHWISAAVSLTAMFVFSVTGLTLNHAATIGGGSRVATAQAQLPADSLKSLEDGPAIAAATDATPLPAPVADEVQRLVGVKAHGVAAEWSEAEVYVAAPGPGRDAWVSIDRATGSVEAEMTDRGWISFFNDLHKGRNTGTSWFWFIDVLAVACVVFTFTGLLLLQLHARNRPSTWPLVGLGTAVPMIIIVFFMHA